ncbi:MAG: hypothetical protein HC796_04460 [Synechococcaceae cyanobacterium RL_1_2]|nr:hypothetical protein [Synechococcaceae cyanobacterium RL_1_2]
MKSKLLILLGLTSISFSLVACGEVEDKTESTTGGSGESTAVVEEGANGMEETAPNEEVAKNGVTKDGVTKNGVTADWVDYTTDNGNLSVKFPGTPETQTQTTDSDLGELKFTMTFYADEADRQSFMVSSLTYPVDPAEYDAEQGLELAKQGAAENAGLTVVSDEPTEKAGIAGKKLVMNTVQDGQEITTRSEIYIDPNGPTLHQIVMFVEGKEINDDTANAFFDSVQIKPL